MKLECNSCDYVADEKELQELQPGVNELTCPECGGEMSEAEPPTDSERNP